MLRVESGRAHRHAGGGRSRTHRRAWLLVLASAVALVTPACRRDADRRLPSIVLLTLDTVRADRLGCYGRAGAETPNLDRLAREGARFDRAYAPAPLTLPSHASMLTGLYPNRHLLRDNGPYRLRADAPTLAECVKARGYETAAFVSAAPLERRVGLDRGFDRYDDALAERAGTYFLPERAADRTSDAALEWLGPRLRESSGPPLLLWVHTFDAHAPYAPPSPFAERHRESPYEGEIAFMDSQLGRLLDAIAGSSRADDTIVIAVADHGEGLGEHGEKTHGALLYDSTLRIPLIVKAPGRLPAGSVRPDRVCGVDVLPTALALAGILAPRGLDGVDRSVAGTSKSPLFAESLDPWNQWGWAPQFAARSSVTGEKRIWDGPLKFHTAPEVDPAESARSGDSRVLDREILGYASRREEADSTTKGTNASLASARLLALGYVGGVVDPPDSSRLAGLPAVSDRLAILDAIDAAIAWSQAGKPREAETRLARAAREDPENPGLRFYLGHLRDEIAGAIESQPDRRALQEMALADLGIVTTLRPRDSRATLLAAKLEVLLGHSDPEAGAKRARFESAERRLLSLLEVQPEEASAYFLLGNIHSLEGSPLLDLERADRELARVESLRPEDVPAREIRRSIQQRRGIRSGANN